MFFLRPGGIFLYRSDGDFRFWVIFDKNRMGLNRKQAAPAELRPDLLRKASLAAKPSVDKINEYSPVFPTGAPGRKIIGHAFRRGTDAG